MADHDDGSVPDDTFLLRRIHPSQVIMDKNRNQMRPSSGAFDDIHLSVDAESILVSNELDWRFSLAGYTGYSLVKFLASEARSRQLPVIHKPIDTNPAHCEVHGKKTPGIAKALARGSEWVYLEPKAA